MKQTLVLLSLALVLLGLSACSNFQRDPRSGYTADYGLSPSQVESFQQQKFVSKTQEARQELGLPTNQELDENQARRLQTRMRLLRLESKLRSTKARQQYYSTKPYLTGDAAKVQFLSQRSIEARQHWITQRGLKKKDNYPEPVKAAIEENDIVLGMTKQAVLESWGDPEKTEVAGDPLYGNERWRYKQMISSTDGYSNQTRLIYFEAGRVAGWETY